MEAVTPDESLQAQEPDEDESPSPGDEREDRRAAVWDGMLAGKSYRVMAADLGVSRQTILRDTKVLRRRWKLVAERYEDHARLDLARIEKLIAALWPVALEGGKNGQPDKFAVDRIVVLLDRKAKMLGNDKPIRHEGKLTVEHTSTLDMAIEELLAQFPKMPDTEAPTEADPEPSPNGNGHHP